jgi:hypothetical protein
LEGVAPWSLEAGAELIHGENSILRQLTMNDDFGVHIPAKSAEILNYVFWADTDELLSIENGVPEYEKLYRVMDEVLLPSSVTHCSAQHRRGGCNFTCAFQPLKKFC